MEPVDEPSVGSDEEGLNTVRLVPEPPKAKRREPRRSTPLDPGLVRKKVSGEVGRVRAVDPRAGTVTVQWLRDGRTSTVPLASVTRR